MTLQHANKNKIVKNKKFKKLKNRWTFFGPHWTFLSEHA